MIPGSKWVKVEYTEGEEKGHYIVGIIYDEQGAPMHICYGVPGQFALAPPDNLAKYCQWLPASIKDPQGKATGCFIRALKPAKPTAKNRRHKQDAKCLRKIAVYLALRLSRQIYPVFPFPAASHNGKSAFCCAAAFCANT